MDKATLKVLAASKNLTLNELKTVNPKAFDVVSNSLTANRKSLLASALQFAPPAATAALESLEPDDINGDAQGAVARALDAADVSDDHKQDILTRLAFLGAADLETGGEDLPLAFNPALRAALGRAALGDVAEALRLGPQAITALTVKADDLNGVTDDTLQDLVKAGMLADADAKTLGLRVSLYHLAGGETQAADALANARFTSLKGHITGLKDIVAIPPAELAKALKDAGVGAPAGTTLEDMAGSILQRTEEQFPFEAIRTRLGGVNAGTIATNLKAVTPLAAGNENLFQRDFAALDVSAIPARSRTAAARSHAELARIVRRYPGLRLEKIITAGGTSARVAKALTDRIAMIDTVVNQNPNVEFLALDYSAGSDDLKSLNTDGISAADRSAVLSTFKAQQRVYAVTNDAGDTVRMMEAGYDSALSIAKGDVDLFASRSGFDLEKATSLHAKATSTLAMVTATVGSIVDIMKGGFAGMLVGNVFEDVSDSLRQMEGYADLFGPQDSCDCDHCESIMSPAAYFVDLMRFVEENVTDKVFTGVKADHALRLEVRRPDLWTLPLTCANTDNLVPTLDIVNKILEDYTAKRKKPTINLGDQAAVRNLVYGDLLKNEKASFQTPFVLPVMKADIYLEPFAQTRADLLQAVGLHKSPRETAAYLKISKPEYDVIITPNTGWPYLRSLFQVDFTVPASGTANAVDVQDILPATGLTRAEFGDVVATLFVQADGTRDIKITPSKRSVESVQNDIERISGLKAAGLDAIQRFIRLWRALPWTIQELDLVLKQRSPSAHSVINAAALQDIVVTLGLIERFGLPVEQAVSLWSDVPRVELIDDRRSLFDRAFNNRPYTITEGLFPKPAVSFVHPAFRSNATPLPEDNSLQRLLLGLQLSETALAELITALASPLGADLHAPNENNRGFKLTLANLTLLYRHAKLMKLLRRSAGELLTLIGLAGVAGGAAKSIADLEKLVAFDDWARGSGYTLDDVLYVTGGTVTEVEAYPTAAQLAADIVDQVAAEGALLFADTVFAFVPGVTEDMSRTIVAANPGLFESQALGMLRLKASTGMAPALTVPPGVPASAADLQAALARYHTGTVLPARIAAKLAVPADKLAALAKMASTALDTTSMATALQGGNSTPLESALGLLAKLAVLFKSGDFTTPRVAFLDANRTLVGLASVAAVPIQTVRSISAYQRLHVPNPAVAAEDTPNSDAVDEALTSFTAAQKFAALPADRLAEALGTRAPVATTLASLASLGNDAIAALATIAALLRLSRDSSLAGDTIKLLISETDATLDRGAEALVSTLRQLYPEDASFDAQMEPLDNRIRSRKRDALADYLIRHSNKRFLSLDDLYNYFLIDVQFMGCARTSYVVAAISSVQTYVHRILLNLEQDEREPTEPDHVHVLPSLIPADEWAWRKNYRVWEANRKVFLWPENYIEPELRDDKTPLFKALEDTLLQQDITEQNVLDAYGAYLDGFSQLADLKIAGVYHELSFSSETDVVHIFGCTADDPPVYYYWTISNLYYGKYFPDRQISYSARRKIDVSISARTVTPVVYLGRLHIFWTEISTSPSNVVKSGETRFVGYKHKVGTKFSFLRLDGAWTPPQAIALLAGWPIGSGSAVSDTLTIKGSAFNNGVPYFAPNTVPHSEPQDGYTLTGFQWNSIYPTVYGPHLITNFATCMRIARADLFERELVGLSAAMVTQLQSSWSYNRRMLHIGQSGDQRKLFTPTVRPGLDWGTVWSPHMTQAVAADIDTFEDFLIGLGVWPDWVEIYAKTFGVDTGHRGSAISTLRDAAAVATAVNGSPSGAGLILQSSGDSMYIFKKPGSSTAFEAHRLGTTIARDMSRILFTGGINALLELKTQKDLGEDDHLLTASSKLDLVGAVNRIDFGGPLGVYFKEIFFHIPALLADQLNTRQNYAACQSWYHYIFDPTASLDPGVSLAGLSKGQTEKVLRDRVWRYIQFRNLTPPKMRDILTDEVAIKAYKEDPFNPHAIARLRISAYQKSVVMKYVSNLIDWGDSLFSQFTMESVNEAIVLYVMASEILGRRPADVGDCGEGTVTPKTYENIRPALEKGSEFLMEVESVFWIAPQRQKFSRVSAAKDSYLEYRRPEAEISLKETMISTKVIEASTVTIKPKPYQDGFNASQQVVNETAILGGAMSLTGAGLREKPITGSVLRSSTLAAGQDNLAAGLNAEFAFNPTASPTGAGSATSRSREANAMAGSERAVRERAPREEILATSDLTSAVMSNVAAGLMAEVAGARGRADAAVSADLRAELSAMVDTTPAIGRQLDWKKTRPAGWAMAGNGLRKVVANDQIIIRDFGRIGGFGWGIVRQLGPVFCVPQNKDLIALWDRVDDRLYKIRHCLDINGERRDLALFAPEIDPRLLVRARAEGLSLDDILGASSGNLPPYRFAYLIEKARQYAAQVQGFGSQLLSAIEKRDMEELTKLRNTQQLNMMRLNTKIREWELQIAEQSVSQLELQQAAVEYRRDYYSGLLDTDLLPWERTQQVLRHGSTAFYTLGALFGGTAGVLNLIPQIGSPFAMKYGGVELGGSFKGWSKCFSDTAKLMDVFAASAGLEASFERRREGWEHQVDLAKHELKQIDKQIKAANIRRDIATKAIELHDKSIEEQEEIIDFFESKFSNLGLYTWMASTMQRLYRQSFNSAQAMAKLAERAYRFERGDETTPLLQATYWDAAHAGLLAGEHLMADLNEMDRRFIETNYRTIEIDQSFSLMQLAPGELLTLKQTGECEIAIPEVAFDLYYPGQYRRRIKAARLTIPCVTGPYTNVSATLTLKQSFVRKEAKMGAAALVEVPLRHTNTMATSTAQNDAGIFDFSFRDERYMPFEGAGAVSIWSLTLPKSFRPLDYSTINDVIINLSYTSLLDGLFRQKVEDMNAALEGTILNVLSNQPLARALSLRQDYSSSFQRMLNSAPGTPITLDIDDRALPIALRGRNLTIARALLLLRGGEGATGAGAAIKINGKNFNAFQNDAEFPGYRSANIQTAFATGFLGRLTLSLDAAGDFAPNPANPGDPAAADPGRLLDIVLFVEMKL